MGKTIRRLTKGIEIVFYVLFFTVPLAMHPHTNELFEFNKMWLVFIYSLIIFFLWGTKMILNKKFEIRRTPFDIPLLLFLLSQIVSTIFSLDRHTSFWGYYSRFNGGLLSTISYIFLYYAFATNMIPTEKEEIQERFNLPFFAAGIMCFIIGVFMAAGLVEKSGGQLTDVPQTFTLIITLIASFTLFHFSFKLPPVKKVFAFILTSGALVALWGLPSHFGFDPTCLVFRGSLDVACWTEGFQPKIRMFSTLGQPNWLATFLATLIPISIAFGIDEFKKIEKISFNLPLLLSSLYLVLALLFYIDMSWTLSQSGFIGFWGGNIIFSLLIAILIIRKSNFSPKQLLSKKSFRLLIFANLLFLLANFFIGNPIPKLQKFQFSKLISPSVQKTATPTQNSKATSTTPPPSAGPALENNITGSGEIRSIVWKGALDVFAKHPLIGSGVETFAFAYYQSRPAAHNLTSEWDYLYNKAHNEFLNYLATTGLFGFLSYMSFIFLFIGIVLKSIYKNFRKHKIDSAILPALLGAFISILISNFFGFSVVLVNLLFFLIPVFYFAIDASSQTGKIKFLTIPYDAPDNNSLLDTAKPGQVFGIIGIGIFSVFSIIFLVNYWFADKEYALGYNLNHVNEYVEANKHLEKAVAMRGGEDLYSNELSSNLATIAVALAQDKQASQAALYGQRAKDMSDMVASKNPNNVVYFKTRTRVLFALTQLQPSLLQETIDAISTANKLAPTDAKILYNKALLLDQANKKTDAIAILDETIHLKDNYRDAYYAQALFLSQLVDSLKKTAPIKAEEYRKKAIERLNYTLKIILPNDQQAEDLLKKLNP